MDSSSSSTPLSAAERVKLARQNRDLNETPEDRKVRLGKAAEQTTLRRQNQQPEQRKSTLQKDAEQHRLQREQEKEEQREVRLSKAAASKTYNRLNASEIRDKEIAGRGFIENWMLDAKDSNPFYKHALFPESHNSYV
jgi:exonuclease VII large subunit